MVRSVEIKMNWFDDSGDIYENVFVFTFIICKNPCPDITSIHPWSIVFKELMVTIIGNLNINCVDSGIKNHIFVIASCIIGFLNIIEFEFVVYVVIYRPIKIPISISSVGIIFIVVGII